MSLLIKVDLVLNVSLLDKKKNLCVCIYIYIYILYVYIFLTRGKNRKYPFLFITGFT